MPVAPPSPKRMAAEMGWLIDITGQRFGRLVALHRVPATGQSRQARWRCRCDCGDETEVVSDKLRRSLIKSCGCLFLEVARQTHRTHGASYTPTYVTWEAMKARCCNPKHPKYKTYGAKGIYICDEWLGSFEAFLRDMGERPEGLTIERKDPFGPYTPGNCVWADSKTQGRNRTVNRYVEVDGRRMCMAEACELHGHPVSRVLHRLDRGWDLMDALRTPKISPSNVCAWPLSAGRAASQKARSRRASSGSGDKAP